MRTRTLVALALIVVPGSAFAQRGGGRPKDPLADMANASSAERDRGVKLSRANVEDMNPLSFLLDKKGDLKLTDAQVASIQSARDSVNARNADLLARIDPLVYATRPPSSGDPVESEQQAMNKARSDLSDVVKQIRQNYEAAAVATVGSMPPDQQKQATDLLKKHRDDVEKTLRKALGRG